MKWLLRYFLISTVSLWLVNKAFPQGLVMSGDIYNFLKVGAGLTIANILVRPLMNMVMLPINLLTFGLLRWVTNVAILWLVIRFVGGVSIQSFAFQGLNFNGFIIPAWPFYGWMAWLAIAFALSIVSGLMVWLTE